MTLTNGRKNRKINSKPFLRWAGGKRRLVDHLLDNMPETDYETYWEPFLGSGALFFALTPEKAILSDVNSELIACYRYLAKDADLIFRYLNEHIENDSKDYYFKIREHFNDRPISAAQAARFLYLNRAGFNGIFRVNQNGNYNVPYGKKSPPPSPTKEDLRKVQARLQNAELYDLAFDTLFEKVQPDEGDFIYFDPPYPPLNKETANFTHYTDRKFNLEDHKKLAQHAKALSQKGCNIMISNSDTSDIRDLFRERFWRISRLPVKRWIAANGNRKTVDELIITNY